jgi:GTP diphosphokinase / guanosine-3',5'-bis(diphosphate) 3'-diphosphatase
MISNETLEEAIIFAVKKHKGQKRKGNGIPYIMHPIRVMNNLYLIKRTQNVNLLMAACVLHDTAEDCDVTINEIARRFGHHVAALVEELTSEKLEVKKAGKQEYLIQKMLGMSSYALCIKLSDRLDNVRDTQSMSSEFRHKYFSETLYIMAALKTKRKLTKTHKALVGQILREVQKGCSEASRIIIEEHKKKQSESL